MNHFLRVCLSAAIFAATLHCSPSADRREGAIGIAEWSVDSTPVTVLGGIENDTVAIAIGIGATRLDDGSIVVADRGEFGLLYFDANGELLKRALRKGKGPGEADYVARLWRCGPALYLYDIDGYGVSEFSLDGTFKRLFRFGVVDDNPVPYASACNAKDEFIHYGWELHTPKREPGVSRLPVAAWTSRADSLVASRLPDVVGSERWNTPNGSRPLALGRETLLAAAPGAFYVGQATTFAIDVFDFDGTHLRTVGKPHTPQPIGPADIAAAIEREVADHGERRRKSIENGFAEMELPTHAPPYRSMLVDRVDNLWVQEYPMAGRRDVTWSVFSPTGQHLANVALPVDLEVFEIGTDYVLGRRLNAVSDAPEVHLYRLSR